MPLILNEVNHAKKLPDLLIRFLTRKSTMKPSNEEGIKILATLLKANEVTKIYVKGNVQA